MGGLEVWNHLICVQKGRDGVRWRVGGLDVCSFAKREGTQSEGTAQKQTGRGEAVGVDWRRVGPPEPPPS
jgi:hypothetical protein